MDSIKYFLSLILGMQFVISALYGVQLGYFKEKQMEINFQINSSGIMAINFYVPFTYFIFQTMCSSINEELFTNMQIKIQKISEAKLILDHLEEQIIIIEEKDQQIDFINQKFADCFKNQIDYHNEIENKKQFCEAVPRSYLNFGSIQSVKQVLYQIYRKTVDYLRYILNFESLQQHNNLFDLIKGGTQFIQLKLFFEIDKKSENESENIQNDQEQQQGFNCQDQLSFISFQDLLKYDLKSLERKIFKIIEVNEQAVQQQDRYKINNRFVQIKKKSFIRNQKHMIIFQVIDISNSILYDQSKAQNEFLQLMNATVSHELSNPLNSICAENIQKENLLQDFRELLKDKYVTFQDLILKGFEIIGQLEKSLEAQQASSGLMKIIIQDMQDYSQIKNGKFKKNISRFDIVKTIEYAMNIQKRQAEDKKIQFYSNFVNIENLNQQQDLENQIITNQKKMYSSMIETDEQRLIQVLLSLQSNALKFTEKGSVIIQIQIKNVNMDNFLEISVIDTGIGIPLHDQDKLFKLFGFIQDGQNANKNGIGLGLVIAENIVHNFGGKITFESKPNVGSTFKFTFNINQMNDSEDTIREYDHDDQFSSLNEYFQIDKGEFKDLYFLWQPKKGTRSLKKRKSMILQKEDLENQKYIWQIQQKRIKTFNLFAEDTIQEKSQIQGGHQDQNLSPRGDATVNDIQNSPRFNEGSMEYMNDIDYYKHKKILIVDDVGFNIQALEILLKYYGKIDTQYVCNKAMNGKEAVEIIQRDVLENNNNCSYGLILMDCNMPIMDGYQATEQIRQFIHQRGIPQPLIIATTGHSEQTFVKRAIMSGMNQVFSKPVKKELLISILQIIQYCNALD